MDSSESINLTGLVPNWNASVPLVENAVLHLDFLSTICHSPHLQNENVLHNAIRRYEMLWLPMVSANREAELEPPLDVHWIWHCHMLSPVIYAKDCQDVLRFVPDHKLRRCNSEDFYFALANAEKLWARLYPAEPFDCSSKCMSDVNANVSDSHQSRFEHDLIEATRRQKDFYYQVSLPHFKDFKFLGFGLDRYVKFLHLKKNHPNVFTVPMYDIDLLWHTHQLSPSAYRHDTTELLGHVLNHDDKDQDRGPTSKLSRSSSQTRSNWYQMYGDRMAMPGTCYRGNSLSKHIHKDPLRLPIALRCMLHMEKLTLSGGQPTDIIQASVCTANTSQPLLNLPTVEGTPVKWVLNQYVMTDHIRSRPIGDLNVVPVNRSGLWGTLIGTSLPMLRLVSEFYIDEYVPQKYMVHPSAERLPCQLPVTLEACEAGYKAVLTATLTGVRPADTQTVTLHWGKAITAMLTGESGEALEEWEPINLPTGCKRIDKAVPCTVSTHSVKMRSEVLYTVRVIQSAAPPLNTVQVFNGEKLVALSELCSSDQLPRPQQVQCRSITITLDTQRGENAMLIKGSAGDWGIIKGCRTHSVRGANDEALVIPGQLETSLTLLSPYRVGRFSITERGLWQRLGLPGATSRRFELFGSEGVAVDMETANVQLGKNCTHIAEFIAVLFSVWI